MWTLILIGLGIIAGVLIMVVYNRRASTAAVNKEVFLIPETGDWWGPWQGQWQYSGGYGVSWPWRSDGICRMGRSRS